MMKEGFSVLMPTYNQAAFIRRAILSLQRQTYTDWELIIINDGCTDDTEYFISDFLSDGRIHYIKNEENQGLGYALNQGLDVATYKYVAYLPSDDFYYENHLESIKKDFDKCEDITLVYTGMKYDTPDTFRYVNDSECKGVRPGYCLQLVQTAHKKVDEQWLERQEWVTDDLFSMYWSKLLSYGIFSMTYEISCFWTSHPHQRHKIISEKFSGGINQYRSHYKIQTPIKMRVSKEKFVDEEALYSEFRTDACKRPPVLKVLLVGELAYNAERVYALEQAGCKLYGLWMSKPTYSFSTVGHLPFGNVEDLSYDCWKQEIERVKPDVIYALLNFGAIPLSYEVLKTFPDIPFVWHFKEGPSAALGAGTWDKLIYLYTYSTVKIYLNETVKNWFAQFIPQTDISFIMDGDLPKKEYFKDCYSPKLSEKDGEIHTVVAGRMIGVSDEKLLELAEKKIHVHLYIENYHASKEKNIDRLLKLSPEYFHVHSHCGASDWTKEFSQYDAGWLHCVKSHNEGDYLRMTWDDMNLPARINTYMAAGIPVILPDNSQHIVAVESCVRKLGIGICFSDYEELANKLKDRDFMTLLSENVNTHRPLFCFDYYVPQLIELFEKAIKLKKR